MNAVVVGVFAYLAAQLALGVFLGRRIATEEQYLLAGRSLGPTVAVFTIFATWFGAETCVGAAGQAFAEGLNGTTADPFGYALCLVVMGAVFAVPLWKRRLTTLADLFRQRYGVGVERLAVLLMVPTSVLWAAAQIRAFGQVLSATSGLEVPLAVSVAAAVVIVYTTTGGFLADAISDMVQGVVLVLGLLALGAAFVASGDAAALAAVPAERFRLVDPGAPLLDTLEGWAVPVVGSVVAQELVARIVAIRSPGLARRAALAAGGLYLAVGLVPVLIGLAAAGQLAVADPEHVLIRAAEHYLPLGLYIVFAGALVSAILSTVDSALLVAGSLAAHNVVLPLLRLPAEEGARERRKVLVNRAAVVLAGLVAYGLALASEGVYHLVEEASGLGTSGVFVAVVFALFTGFGGAWAATASLLVGLGVYVVGGHLAGLDHPFLASLAAALAAYLLVGAAEGAGGRGLDASGSPGAGGR